MSAQCRSFTRVLVGACCLMLLAGPVRGQVLVEHVPDDALLYVGWQGTEALGEAFEASHFQAMREAADAEGMVGGLLPMAGMFLGESAGPVTQSAGQLGDVLWQRPWALFVGDPAAEEDGGATPTHRLGLLVDAGSHAEVVRTALHPWEQALADADTPATWVEQEGVVGLMIGYSEQQVRDIHVMWRSLDDDADFSAARRKVMPDAALLVYINTQRAVQHVADAAAQGGLLDASQAKAAIARLGLDGLERIVYGAGLHGRMWQTELFVEAPAPRRGLVKLLDAEPITEQDLEIVPRSASWLSAYRLDPAVALPAIDTALPSLSAVAGPADAELREQLVAGLGDLWLFYSDPSFVTPTGPGIALVHPLRDAKAVAGALEQLAARIPAAPAAPAGATEESETGEAGQTPAVEQVVIEGATIHQVAAPDGSVALAWTVADGRLYIGTGAATVASARSHAARPGNDVTQNHRYQRVRERLGDPPAGARLTFADLQSTAPAMFQGYSHAMQLGADGAGMDPPLPNLRALMPYLLPAGQAGWADEDGWRARSIAPCPAANLLSPCATINLGTGALAAALLYSVPAPGLASP